MLAKWNRRINLTSLPLDPVSDLSIDRLVIEPLIAARWIRNQDRLFVDIGTGGGSPAIPLKLAVPQVHLVMVEVKVRKSAFLREVIRELHLENVEVETRRYEELLTRPDLTGAVDVCSIRAVRSETGLWKAIAGLAASRCRILWFADSQGERWPSFEILHTERFAHGGTLTVLEQIR
jgi:16S rRNA (guanine527-N7)-methyltransferase